MAIDPALIAAVKRPAEPASDDPAVSSGDGTGAIPDPPS
jgi:hypothetical protein